MNHVKWSKTEKKIAREAFERAYERECSYLAGRIREKANQIKKPDDIWELHDFLTEKRKEVDEKYDYRYSVLDFVFGRLIKEGWLNFADLVGLKEEKIERLKSLLRFSESNAEG
ncbi:MAG: hypothetical protein PVG01_00485 [Desulfobacterales bacterium]